MKKTLKKKKRTEHGLQHSAESQAALAMMADRLRAKRTEAGLKPDELAKAIGCSKQVIYHIENGDCFPSMPVYLAICRIFKQPYPYLFQ